MFSKFDTLYGQINERTDCLVVPKREGNNCPRADPTGLANQGTKI